MKKKELNGKRRRSRGEPDCRQGPEGEVPSPPPPSPPAPSAQFDPGMVHYLRMATSLIEGRRVTRDEVLEMLNRVMRQHSLARERRIDYVLRYLTERPP